MNLLIAGGSGFVGQFLSSYLTEQGHTVWILTRNENKASALSSWLYWDGITLSDALYQPLKDLNAIINLCGLDISARRWNKQVKQSLINSRVKPTQALVNWIESWPHQRKPCLLNASAIGFYPSDKDIQTEEHALPAPGHDFSHQLVKAWESEAHKAVELGAQVSCLRFGVVLGEGGGVIKKIWPTYQFGLGAIMGNPKAYMSWVHIRDLARAIDFLLSRTKLNSVYNLTAPNPCTQAQLAQALSKLSGMPRWLHLPAAIVKFIFGEMGEALLLANQSILPKHLEDEGFTFEYPKIDDALANILKGGQS